MRIKLMIICLTLLCGYAKAQTRGGDSSPPLPKEVSAELFDKAVGLIKEFEGWHDHTKHPYIGYGHKLLPHENLTADITEAQADSLLRADLLERYKYFRQYGKDALLLTVLAYNVGGDYESRMFFDKMLRENGVFQQLEDLGIKDGDIVSMYELEFEYQH